MAIDWLLSSPRRSPGPVTALWQELYEAARECWLTIAAPSSSKHAEDRIRRLFCRHPLVFGARVDEAAQIPPILDGGYARLLARDLDLLGGDDVMLAICYFAARDNGVGSRAMQAVRGHYSARIESLLRQFVRWQNLERAKQRLPTNVLADIQRDLDASPLPLGS